jgi:signal transduction histidine kinase
VVKDDEGNAISVILLIRDITDRLYAEAELVRARDKAEESDRLKSAFLANLSHEIRTPLNGIAGLLNILAADPELSAGIRENIGVINDNSEHLIALIDDVLDVARLETGQMAVHPEPVCIAGMMNDLNSSYTQHLQAEGKAHIALEYSADGITATHTDPKRLRQILNHLLSNAVKFTERGHIRFGCRLQGADMLEFFVEDTGIGIPQSQLDAIFQSFRQADPSNSRHYGGLGLGLSISRGLAKLMGGNMRAESVEGKGSTFVFTIAHRP